MMKMIIITAAFILISSDVRAEEFPPEYGHCLVMPEDVITSLWTDFSTAMRSNQWQQALSYCSTNVQKAASVSTNALPEFFGAIGVSGPSSSNLVGITMSPEGNRVEGVFKSDNARLRLVGFVKENGKWKIVFDQKQ